jgi:hypothetical protein
MCYISDTNPLFVCVQGSDPSKYELIQKVRLLQKRLLAQAETAIKQEDQLQQLESQCSSLREMLARQPGPEVAVQLKTAQDALKARDKKIKVCHPVVAAGVVAVTVLSGGGGVVGTPSTNFVFKWKLFQNSEKKLYVTKVIQFSFEVFITVIEDCSLLGCDIVLL